MDTCIVILGALSQRLVMQRRLHEQTELNAHLQRNRSLSGVLPGSPGGQARSHRGRNRVGALRGGPTCKGILGLVPARAGIVLGVGGLQIRAQRIVGEALLPAPQDQLLDILRRVAVHALDDVD